MKTKIALTFFEPKFIFSREKKKKILYLGWVADDGENSSLIIRSNKIDHACNFQKNSRSRRNAF